MNPVLRNIIVFSVLVVLAGCSVHKRQRVVLPTAIPESYTEADAEEKPTLHIEHWWNMFNDQKLNFLMGEAFSHNLDLSQAFARYEQLEALRRKVTASQSPFVTLEGQASRDSQPSFAGDNIGNSYRFSSAAGYELDLWEKLKSGTEAAALDAEASREDIKSLYMSLSAQLAEFYYLAVEQREQLNLTNGTIESFQDALARVELRYQEGIVPALDVYQARQNLASAQIRRPVFESNLAVTEHAIAVLLGKYPDRGRSGDLAMLPETPANFPAGLPSELLARRPDVNAALLRLRASDERIAAAIAERFPSFNLLGSYGSSSSSFPTGDISGVFWNLLIHLAQPLLDGGSRTAEVDRRRAEFSEILAQYHKTVLTAFQEVEDALARNQNSEERIVRLEEGVSASKAAQRLAIDQYAQGLSDYLPVLTAQQILFDAESALIEARRQLISDRIQLARALGGEWMDREMENRLAAEYRGKEENE